MATLYNEILIRTSIEKIWEVLATPQLLDRYDPTVRKSVLISERTTGPGTARRVDMFDGKNWFEEKITDYKPGEALTYELTACSFPVHKLKHSYHFQSVNDFVKVSQVMDYTVKFGFIGKIMDVLMVRRQSDAGVKKFMHGLKSYLEAN